MPTSCCSDQSAHSFYIPLMPSYASYFDCQLVAQRNSNFLFYIVLPPVYPISIPYSVYGIIKGRGIDLLQYNYNKFQILNLDTRYQSARLIKSGIRENRAQTRFYWLDSASNREHRCSLNHVNKQIIID